MKVLFVTDTGNIIGGGEFSLLLLLRGLKSKGLEVLLMAPEDGDFTSKVRSFDIKTTIERHFKLKSVILLPLAIKTIFKIKKYIKENKISVIHSNSTGGYPLLFAIAAKLAYVPFVWHVRTIDTHFVLDRLLKSLATRVVAISKYVLKVRFKKCENKKYRVIYNALDLECFTKKSGPLNCPPTLISLGRYVELKGYEHLIELARILRGRNVRFQMKIAGLGYDKENKYLRYLINKVDEYDLKDIVTLMPQVGAVSEFLRQSDIFLFSSRSDAFGRVLIEAMASGIPVVAFNKGAVSEIIDDFKTGIIVDYKDYEMMADAVEKLLMDKKQYATIASKACETVKVNYDYKHQVDKLISVYEGLFK